MNDSTKVFIVKPQMPLEAIVSHRCLLYASVRVFPTHTVEVKGLSVTRTVLQRRRRSSEKIGSNTGRSKTRVDRVVVLDVNPKIPQV